MSTFKPYSYFSDEEEEVVELDAEDLSLDDIPAYALEGYPIELVK